MFFEDYTKTGVVYHIATINDLDKILANGIEFDDKVTYKTKYYGFHRFIDSLRPQEIPSWVKRSQAIFASLNYKSAPIFHSHSVVMSVKVKTDKCWIANENKANQIYEPFILKEIKEFKLAENYIKNKGTELINKYWGTSLSFKENLEKRMDHLEGYDAEVLILHSIPPEDIEVLYIISDHRVLTLKQWRDIFCRDENVAP